MRKIEGFNTGDQAWSAWVSISQHRPIAAAAASVCLELVEVVMPDGAIVRPHGGSPRVLYYHERLFPTQAEARQWVAAQVAAGAASLAKQAADLADPVVVTV